MLGQTSLNFALWTSCIVLRLRLRSSARLLTPGWSRPYALWMRYARRLPLINMQNALVLKLLFKRSKLLRLHGRGFMEIIEIDF